MENKPKHTNYGHRKRIRDRVKKHGIGVLCDHELIEFMLFNLYPRRNTNDIAHSLIERFGSVHGILTADKNELCSVPLVGESCSMFFDAVCEIYRRALTEKNTKEPFDTLQKVGEYFVHRFFGEGREKVCIMLLDNAMHLISCEMIFEGSVNSAALDTKRIYKFAFENNAANVIIAHNHPSGTVIPSEDDIRTTALISEGLGCLGINLCEHFVVSDDRYMPIMRNSHNSSIRNNAEKSLIMDMENYSGGTVSKNSI